MQTDVARASRREKPSVPGASHGMEGGGGLNETESDENDGGGLR